MSHRSKEISGIKCIVSVKLDERSYNIIIGESILAETGELIGRAVGNSPSRIAVISNKRVFSLYGSDVIRSLCQAGFSVSWHLIGDGERYKTLRTAERIYSALVEHHLDRSSVIIALGGGVVGDLAGFVAATFLRGIAYVQVPTTLLAAIDSSVGGKTAVNLPQGKNLVGAFHQPRLVITDIHTLHTLPQREMIAGLCEAIKYGVIRDRNLFDFISKNLDAIKNLEAEAISYLVARCCEIKAEVVQKDERESGLRQILNFGHTFGHALEAVSGFRMLKHGEAVGCGMIMASKLAVELGMLSATECDRLRAAIAALGRFPSLAHLDAEDIIRAMLHDKKARGGKLTLVLPVRIGHVELCREVPFKLVKHVVRQTLAGEKQRPGVRHQKSE